MAKQNQNTAMQVSTSTQLEQASQEKLEVMNEKAQSLKSLILNAKNNPFSATLAVAACLQSIRELMNDKVIMDGVMLLQGTKLGFVTDRDNPKSGPKGYPMETVVDVTIEAASKGALMVGNEVNIISGACYLTKAYFQRMLDEKLGKGNWRLNHHVPKTILAGKAEIGAEVTTDISWTDSSGEHKDTVTHRIKGNSYSTADAYLGKADRKAGKWLLENITGERFNDGDADDIITVQAQSVQEEVTIDATPANPEKLEWVKFLCSQPAIMEESDTIEIYRELQDGDVTADDANTMHKRLVRLFRAKGLTAPTPADFEKSKKPAAQKAKQEEQPADNAQQEEKPVTSSERAFQIKRLHAQGNEIYGKDWDAERLKLVQSFCSDYTSASQLTDGELKEANLMLLERKQAQ